jgi:adenosine deaminase
MTSSDKTNRINKFISLPKVDLHRHFEGSLRISTLQEIANKNPHTLPPPADLPALVQIQPQDELSYTNFLSKFQILRHFFQSRELIQRMAYEVVTDAAADGVMYLELRFAPAALCQATEYTFADVMDWMIESTQKASREHGIITRLITTVNRHESVSLAEEIASLAVARIPRGIVGIDLAGNEADYPLRPFAAVLRLAKASGLALTVHAGEWGPAENVRLALEEVGADRIGHGVRVMEEEAVVEIARQKNTVFEVCITSNLQSGVISDLKQHPLPQMLKAGLNATLNTDDPGISQITLSEEYQRANQVLGIPLEAIGQRILLAAESAFLPQSERQQLINRLRPIINEVVNNS